MDRPTDAGNFAESAYTQFPQSIQDLDTQNNYALLILLGAIGQAFQQQDTLAHADGDHEPWTILLDIDRIPDEGVPWLGQFIGVQVDYSLSVNDQKQQIREHVGWGRGTVETLKTAVRKFLFGTNTVDIIERDTSAYHFTVNTYGGETPPDTEFYSTLYGFSQYQNIYISYGDYEDIWFLNVSVQIAAAIDAAKPAGLQYVYTVTPGLPGTAASYMTLWIDYATYLAAYNAFQTYQDLYNNP